MIYHFQITNDDGSARDFTIDAPDRSEESRLLQILSMRKRDGTGKITVGELCNIDNLPNTPRAMYTLIRELREEYGAPIIGDHDGIAIANTAAEVREFCEWLERKAKADISSMLRLRNAMQRTAGTRNSSIFDEIAGKLEPEKAPQS